MKKNMSPRQLAANRANARKSTGPKTIEGKLRSRFNSLLHGLAAVTTVLPGEDAERYDWRRQEYMQAIQPANIVHSELVDLLCFSQWRVER